MAIEHPRLSLKDRLVEAGIATEGVRVLRIGLHGADRTDDIRSLGELPLASALAYARMQNGRRFGEGPALIFLSEAHMRARLAGYVEMKARRPGLAPGDIIYDPDLAPLLHNFIARCRHPVFYDALERTDADRLIGRLVIRWPAPAMRNVRWVDDPALTVEEE